MNNTLITELKENTFSDITFDYIEIEYCSKLKTIHKNTFNGTDQVTTALSIGENQSLFSPDNSIFEAMSKFVLAHSMQLHENNITEIPSNAFNNSQDNLNYLFLIGETFRKLGSYAFSKLKSLIHLDIIDTSIDSIPENAFEFNEESNQSLVLTLASD